MDPKILIIDSSEHYMEMVTVKLRNYGHQNLICASNGQIGWEKIRAERPDLILIETRLPDIDGFEFCQKIKDSYEKMKVILMTGLAEKYKIADAFQVKADEYVIKTFDCLQVMVAIKKLLSQIEVSHINDSFLKS